MLLRLLRRLTGIKQLWFCRVREHVSEEGRVHCSQDIGELTAGLQAVTLETIAALAF